MPARSPTQQVKVSNKAVTQCSTWKTQHWCQVSSSCHSICGTTYKPPFVSDIAGSLIYLDQDPSPGYSNSVIIQVALSLRPAELLDGADAAPDLVALVAPTSPEFASGRFVLAYERKWKGIAGWYLFSQAVCAEIVVTVPDRVSAFFPT